MKELIKPKGLECEICIQLLLDKKGSEVDRIAAAESLMWCNSESSKDALFKVIMDDLDLLQIREEAAGSLGTLWAESEINYERLAKIHQKLLPELTSDFPILGVKIDTEKLEKFK